MKLALDTECYIDYFLVMFKSRETGKVVRFEKYEGQPLDCRGIIGVLSKHTIITFNGMNYDMSMLALALAGASCADLKTASNRIIDEGLRGWQFEQQYEVCVPVKVDHIDLCEPVPGVMISLKLYGARLHSKRLQDLPIEHTASISPAERTVLIKYCENDLDTTLDLYDKATDPKDNIIATREALGLEYGMDLRSKSDAQIAEAVFKSRVEALLGHRINKPIVPPGTVFQYKPPAFLRFDHPALQKKFAEIKLADFVINAKGKVNMPACLSAKPVVSDDEEKPKKGAPKASWVTIGGMTYTMGIGGLHSQEKSKGHIGTERVLLRDVDVASFYPKLILNCGLFPSSMGVHFQPLYQEFFDQRISAKAMGDAIVATFGEIQLSGKSVAQTLKIVLNGSFGKLGSMHSVLYSPDLLIQVTVTGQLALLMLIERFEAAGIPVISANTDGVVTACPAHLDPLRCRIVAQWEKETNLQTEETRYRALFSRDVNNYLALKEGKGFKSKGTLTAPGVQKNPSNTIVNEAVTNLLDLGIPVAETILKCRDVRKFLRVKRVTGGAHMVVSFEMVDDWTPFGLGWVRADGSGMTITKKNVRPHPVRVPIEVDHLGKVVRWYRRVGETRCIEYVTNGNKVGGSDGAGPLMTLPDTLPVDIDYDFYVREANDLLREIGAFCNC